MEFKITCKQLGSFGSLGFSIFWGLHVYLNWSGDMRGKFFFLYAYEICERNSVGKVLLFGHKPFLQVIDS